MLAKKETQINTNMAKSKVSFNENIKRMEVKSKKLRLPKVYK